MEQSLFRPYLDVLISLSLDLCLPIRLREFPLLRFSYECAGFAKCDV